MARNSIRKGPLVSAEHVWITLLPPYNRAPLLFSGCNVENALEFSPVFRDGLPVKVHWEGLFLWINNGRRTKPPIRIGAVSGPATLCCFLTLLILLLLVSFSSSPVRRR